MSGTALRNQARIDRIAGATPRWEEDALGFRHSEPQAYFGSAVKDLGLP